MKTKRIAIIAIPTGAVLLWLAFGFFGIQALFLDNAVNEDIPAILQTTESREHADDPATATVLGSGSFQQGDSNYTISGNAFYTRQAENLLVTFTDFTVTNGPNLFVYAVDVDATDNQTVKEAVANGHFLNLGRLKGNIGNQNYALDAAFNPQEYPVIAIWCRRFTRNFGAAYLAP